MHGPIKSKSAHSVVENDHQPRAMGFDSDWGPPWIGPIHRRVQIDLLWLTLTVPMLVFGCLFFGWRGLLGVFALTLATLATYICVSMVLRLVRPESVIDSNLHALGLGLLLGITLPPMCGTAVALIGGVLLGVVAHMVGRSHHVRVHPVAVVVLVLWVLLNAWGGGLAGAWLGGSGSAPAVLRPERVVVGDICNLPANVDFQLWWSTRPPSDFDALPRIDPYGEWLSQQKLLLSDPLSLPSMLGAGRLQPVGELVLGVIPGPFGASSRGLLIAFGMYLMYRRLSWWPTTVAALFAMMTCLLLLPLSHHGQATMVFWRLLDLGPAVSVSYLAYTLLVSPMVLIVLILAPLTAPTSTRGRLIYGLIIGGFTIILQWFVAVQVSGFIALVIAGIASRPLDALQKSRFAG